MNQEKVEKIYTAAEVRQIRSNWGLAMMGLLLVTWLYAPLLQAKLFGPFTFIGACR